VLSFAKGCIFLSFEIFSNQFYSFAKSYFLASPKNFGVHKYIHEYSSTANISATPPLSYSWCSHFHPIQGKI
jgi:hypothetical protein